MRNEPRRQEPVGRVGADAPRLDQLIVSAILAVSVLVFAGLIWLIYFHQSSGESAAFYRMLPACNALFNALSAACLIGGYRAVRRRKILLHRRFMLSALAFSALFLTGYVLYHSAYGDTKFAGTGPIRPVYFTILISHIVLTMACLPAILLTVFFALSSRFDRHRRIARYALPIWLYVSVTGVAIFAMLRAYA